MNVNLFRERLAARSISQRQLAQALDVNPMTISAIVTGKADPRVSLAARIADALGVTVDALFPGDVATTPDPPKPRRFRAIPGGAKGTKRPATTAEAGRAGGIARSAKLTKAQRSEAARQASLARWSRAARGNAMCGRHHPALRLIRGGAIRGASDAMQEAA